MEEPMKKPEQPDHYIVGVAIAAQLIRLGYRWVVGLPCGHKHRVEADARACLEKMKLRKTRKGAVYKQRGEIFPVDRQGMPFPVVTAEKKRTPKPKASEAR